MSMENGRLQYGVCGEVALGNFGVLLTFRFVYIFYLIVGGEFSVARIQFLSVSLANVSPFLETFYNIDLVHYCNLY